MSRKILVTGASGFLGRYVLEALTAAEYKVRAAARRWESTRADVEQIIIENICDADWTDPLSGVDAVVHLAALAHRPPLVEELADGRRYVEANTTATLRLGRAASTAGIRDFIFVSSIAVNGSTSEEQGPFDEKSDPRPATIYGQSKLMAETGLSAIASNGSMAVTVVRPPLIYGRHAKGNFPLLVRAISCGIPLPFGSISNRRAFVAAENVANFILYRLKNPGVGYEVFIVADDEQISTAEYARRIGKALGRPARLFPMREDLLHFFLRSMRKTEVYDSTLRSLEVNTDKARAIGWKPIVTLDEGLARTLDVNKNKARR